MYNSSYNYKNCLYFCSFSNDNETNYVAILLVRTNCKVYIYYLYLRVHLGCHNEILQQHCEHNCENYQDFCSCEISNLQLIKPNCCLYRQISQKFQTDGSDLPRGLLYRYCTVRLVRHLSYGTYDIQQIRKIYCTTAEKEKKRAGSVNMNMTLILVT